MNLQKGEVKISVGDDDPEAIKIRQGYDWKLDEKGRVVILNTKSSPDFETILPKLKKGSAETPEIQSVLAHLVGCVLNYK